MALADHLVCPQSRRTRDSTSISQEAPRLTISPADWRKHPLKRKFELSLPAIYAMKKTRCARLKRSEVPDTSLIQISHMGKAIDNTYRDIAVEK